MASCGPIRPAGADIPSRAPRLSTRESAEVAARTEPDRGVPLAVAAVSGAADEAARNLKGMKVLDKAPRGRIAGDCAVERDSGDDEAAPDGALYGVTDASGEEGSGWSLETLGHIRRHAAGDEGSGLTGQLDRAKNSDLRGNCRADTARCTSAAFVQSVLRQVTSAFVRMTDVGMIGIHIGGVIMNSHGDAVFAVRNGDRQLMVMPSPAGDHRCRGQALQRQCDCQQEHHGEACQAGHARSLVDRENVREQRSNHHSGRRERR